MKRLSVLLVCIMAVVLVGGGCSSIKVDRVATDTTIDVSGYWNDADSRMVADDIIEECMRSIWDENFKKLYDRKPVVIVGDVINRTHEHIDAMIFVKDLERALLNSGRVQFVASSDERIQTRGERYDQQRGLTRSETVKKMGDEVGADFILIGTINAIKDEHDKRFVIFYQVNMELIDIQTNEKVWIGEKSIKKSVVRRKMYF